MGLEAREFALRGNLSATTQFSTLFGAKSDWDWAAGDGDPSPALAALWSTHA